MLESKQRDDFEAAVAVIRGRLPSLSRGAQCGVIMTIAALSILSERDEKVFHELLRTVARLTEPLAQCQGNHDSLTAEILGREGV